MDYHPSGPPTLTHIFGTRYRVNISSGLAVIPPSHSRFVRFGRTTVMLRVSTEDKTRFYTLVRKQTTTW